jgi:hypothetical protein
MESMAETVWNLQFNDLLSRDFFSGDADHNITLIIFWASGKSSFKA